MLLAYHVHLVSIVSLWTRPDDFLLLPGLLLLLPVVVLLLVLLLPDLDALVPTSAPPFL